MEVLPAASGISPIESVQFHRTRELAGSLAHAATPQHAPVAASPSDSGSVLISQVAAADIPKLAAILGPGLSAQVAAPLNDLSRLATVAKIDAEGWLAHAAEALETPGRTSIPDWQTRPETLLNVAHRLFDSGGYANYIQSADLARAIVNSSPAEYSPWAAQYAQTESLKPPGTALSLEDDELHAKLPLLAIARNTVIVPRKAAAPWLQNPRLQTLWRRAPLLVLLLSWLGIGLVAGPASILLRALAPESWPASLIDFGFETWGLGFLALVCFGFYARIRDLHPKPPAPTASIVHE